MSGLPKINISFKNKAISLIQRSEKGCVLCVLKGSDNGYIIKDYATQIDTVPILDKKYVDMIFQGGAKKVIVEKLDTTNTLSKILSKWNDKDVDYICYPNSTKEEQSTLATSVKTLRNNKKSTLKAVVSDVSADDSGVINFVASGLKIKNASGEIETITSIEYTPRIAGVLAGVGLDSSSTYRVLNEVVEITPPENADDEINAGKLILIDDGEKVKIARGVTSLTTTSQEIGKDFKKIKTVEAMDMIKRDITKTFADEYIGKVNNSYLNKMLFLSVLNSVYLKSLEGSVLEADYDNSIDLNVIDSKNQAIANGAKIEDMTDIQIKSYPTGSMVSLVGKIKLLDAMEDLNINFTL